MANRFGRAVGGISPFDPKGAIIEGLPAVARGAGQDDEALFSVGNELAGIFGRQADREAQIEGRREGTIAGNDPSFRPTGATTLRGKAFDDAATASYLDTLDAKVRGSMLDVYQANKDNPAALKAGFDALKKDILDNDAFPEVRGQIEASFERLRLPFQVRALDGLEARTQDQARAAHFERTNQGLGIAVTGLTAAPDNPQAQTNARRELDDIKAREQGLVKTGAMTAEQAAKNALLRERQVAGAQWGAKISGLKTEAEATAALEDFRAKRAAGELGAAGRDPELAAGIEDGFLKQIDRVKTQSDRTAGLVAKTADDMLTRAARGAPPPEAEIAQFRQAATTATDGAARVDQFDRRMSWIRTADARGPDAIAAIGRQLRAIAGPTPSATAAADMKWLEELEATRRTAIATDPIGLAARQRVADVAPLAIDDPVALSAGLRDRAALAQALPASVNPTRKMLAPEEVKAITRKIEMGGETAMTTMQALVDGAGRDAPRLMREIGGTAPELAQAGLLLAGGGSPQAAREIIAGVTLREFAKKEAGSKLPEVDASGFGKAFNDIVGPTMADRDIDQSRIREAARTLATYRLRGVTSNKGSDAEAIYKQAIRDVIGEQTIDGKIYGGMGKVAKSDGWFAGSVNVIVPAGVRQDKFRDVLKALRNEDLTALPTPPAAGFNVAHIRNATPVAVEGGYRFAMGDPTSRSDPRFIQDAKGGIFVLPWAEVRGKLRERVGDAFIGGR